MTDTPSDTPLSALPEPVVEPPHRWIPSLVWLVPLLAALVGLSLVVQSVMQRGPTITVSFATGEGIEPGKTKVKNKDVDIGEVKSIHLAPDRSKVLVSIELAKEAKDFAVADTRFWVVRPRLAGTSVSGLGTLLSGSYIGVDGGKSQDRRKDFTGLEDPPVVASDLPGRRFTLHADDIGSLDVGSPIYFRRIQVGHVESFALEPDGRRITLGVFVKSPYDRFVTADSRFWHASGVDLSVDAGGVKLETQSLATILMGGVAFETPIVTADSPPAETGAQFVLATDHAAALKPPDGPPQVVLLRFAQSVRGLSVGATVDFRGVAIGTVHWIGISYDPATGDFTSPVVVELYPDRLGAASSSLPNSTDKTLRSTRIAEMVRRGLRAQLRSGSLLTGQLYVALDFFPDAAPARFDPTLSPPELPTTPGELEELTKQVQAILRKLDKIPFDTLGDDTHRVMLGVEASLKRMDTLMQRTDGEVLPEVRDALRDMRKTLEATQADVSADAPLQQDTRAALRSVAEASRSLKTLTDTLERHPEALVRGKTGTDR
ncbi:MAG TPA: MlaD family protein [Patescibacteria group bacterium]|nr:MlaD family protein [Patescibacteria group bacterium]